MIPQDDFKAISNWIGQFWTGIAPLVVGLAGVAVGAWLTRSWDRQKWINDNRKEECRELLVALMSAMTATIGERLHMSLSNPIEVAEEANRKRREAINVIKTRIFIAEDVAQMKLAQRWAEALAALNETKRVDSLEETFDAIRVALVELVIKKTA